METKPERQPRRHSAGRLAPLAGAFAVLLAGAWAFAPLETLQLSETAESAAPDEQADPPLSTTPALVALNRSAFQTPLWVAPTPPTPPPAPAAPPPPPPPLKLQLLAIIAEDVDGVAGYRAMVYDPDSDKVLLVAPGERLGSRTVDAIDQLTVKLKDGRGTRVLTLKTQAVGGGP